MSLPPFKPPQRLILPIQYLRGIAALMVVWYHARGQFPWVEDFFASDFGASGVDLFFVISGFIMVVTTSASPVTPWQFLQRRIIRVVPLYWLLTLLMVAAAIVMPSLFKSLQVSPVTLVQSLFFVPHFSQSFPTEVWPLLVPGWTLNYEMFFYAIFALSLLLPKPFQLPTFTTVFVVLFAIGIVQGPFSSAAAKIYTSPLLLEFLAGALIGRLWFSHQLKLPLALSLLLIVLGATMLILRDHAPLGVFMQIIGAMLVVTGALDSHLSVWKNKILQTLGDSSYSLYLTHLFALGILRVVWVKLMPNSSSLLMGCTFMVTSLVVCAVVGWLSYQWVEQPLLRLLDRRKSKSQSS